MAKILFVDDEYDVLEGIRRNLHAQRHVWDMDFLTNAEHALQAIRRDTVDVLVTDFRMPYIGGDVLLNEIAESHPGVTPIVLSGAVPDGADEMLRERGVTFLSKPCTPGMLIDAIETAIAGAASVMAEEAAPGLAHGPVFGGAVDLEEYLLMLTGVLVQSNLVDRNALPAEVQNRLSRRHRLPRIASGFLDHYGDGAGGDDAAGWDRFLSGDDR